MGNIDLTKFNRYAQVEMRSIVILGGFTPKIFQPYWLKLKNIIGEEEAMSAKIDVIAEEISQFQVGDWLSVKVTRERAEFKTRQNPYFPVMQDICAQIFQVLSETPVTAVGLNYIYSLTMENEDRYYHIGKELASLNRWTAIMDNPKLNELEIKEETDKNGFTRKISISPTPTEMKVNHGVDFNYNYHYAFKKKEEEKRSVPEVINYFKECAVTSREMTEKILNEFDI